QILSRWARVLGRGGRNRQYCQRLPKIAGICHRGSATGLGSDILPLQALTTSPYATSERKKAYPSMELPGCGCVLLMKHVGACVDLCAPSALASKARYYWTAITLCAHNSLLPRF